MSKKQLKAVLNTDKFSIELRKEAKEHIGEHAKKEADRISKLSRVREFILGAQDGLLVPLGVVTGMAAARPSKSLIIVAGLAEAVAGAVAMGSGSYLASAAEEQLFAAEIEDEHKEFAQNPVREVVELAIVLEQEGLSRSESERVARGLATNENVFLRTKIEKELGLSPDAGGAAMGDALVVGGTYLLAACVPLWPYLVFDLSMALKLSIGCTLVALFCLGVIKAKIARGVKFRSGLQVLLIGTISAAVGFIIGRIVSNLSS